MKRGLHVTSINQTAASIKGQGHATRACVKQQLPGVKIVIVQLLNHGS